MTHLRQLMLDELQRRNYSPSTTRCYIHAVEDFSKYFHRSPEREWGPAIFASTVHLFRDRKVVARFYQSMCALRQVSLRQDLRRFICSMRFLFPSGPGSCRLYSVRRKSRG